MSGTGDGEGEGEGEGERGDVLMLFFPSGQNINTQIKRRMVNFVSCEREKEEKRNKKMKKGRKVKKQRKI